MREQVLALYRRKHRRAAAVVVAASLAAAPEAAATGFFVNQQGVRGLARVDAGNTAAADSLATIFFNPAGLEQTWSEAPGDADVQASAAVHLIVPRSRIRNRGSTVASPGTLGNPARYAGGDTRNPTDPTPVPNLYVARRLAGGASIGVGVNVPFGLETRSSDDWFGRYDAIEASLRTVNASIVGSYRLAPQLAIGGGLDVQYARTTLTAAIPDPLAPGGPSAATDARVSTKGHGWTPGFNVGVIYRPDDDTRIGVHYRSAMRHEIRGSSTFTRFAGPLAGINGEVAARADLRLPAIATVGVWHRVDSRLVLLAELEWYGWGRLDEVRTRFDDGRADAVRPIRYRDAYGVAVGAEYRVAGSPLTTRGGVHYDSTPTVDAFRDTTVPDSPRLWLGLGASYALAPRASVDFAFNHVFFRGTDIALTRRFFEATPLETAVRLDASVKSVVNTLSVDLRYAF